MNALPQASDKLVLFGAAGLVGQNLIDLLRSTGLRHLVCIDKHRANTAILRSRHPDLEVIEADMAEPGAWEEACRGAAAAVMLQAQIGGEIEAEFQRNNVAATTRALAALRRAGVAYAVHVSSSVVNSGVRDWYTESKRAQEDLVRSSDIANCVLRPTLMFGPFDRKHLGWLARFMQRAPVFPVPGNGRYWRQPLYVGDFCAIIRTCLEQRRTGVYDITGRERITYVDMIRTIRRTIGARTRITPIPYWSFWTLLKVYGTVRPNAPFTTKQLEALVAPDEFELIPWWEIFGVEPTTFEAAIRETFGATRAHDPVLEF